MNLVKYQIETKRTLPELGNMSVNLAHMVMGIFSEFSEYLNAKLSGDDVNLSEEIADMFWYISNYCNLRNYVLSDLWEKTESVSDDLRDNITTTKFIFTLSELQDIVKKNLAYNREIDAKKEVVLLISLLLTIRSLWENTNFDLEKSLENNINKLRIRFPDKFSEDLANNRDLKSERTELEK